MGRGHKITAFPSYTNIAAYIWLDPGAEDSFCICKHSILNGSISAYIVSSVLPLGPQNPKQLLPGHLRKHLPTSEPVLTPDVC